MCLYPTLIRNRKYTKTKKNGGIIPPINDKRTLMVPIGCQKCIECRKQKGREWQVRLLEEIRTPAKMEFVTLTFSNENYTKLYNNILEINEGEELSPYDMDNAIAKLAVKRFLERWRKKHKKSVKHWLVTELGHKGTENIHLHGILWTEKKQDISKIWGYGYTYLGSYVNEKTVNYIVKYVMKTDNKHPQFKAKILTSAGIGNGYTKRLDAKLNKYNHTEETKEYYTTRQGHKLSLPIYYRNKIYTEAEREWLWIKRLDKEERYILGTKISIKNNAEQYYQLLLQARAKNQRLGYGNNEKQWDKEEYELQQRWMLQQKRLKSSNVISSTA